MPFREGVKKGVCFESEFACENRERHGTTRASFSDFGKRRLRKVHFGSKVGSEGSSSLLREKDPHEEGAKWGFCASFYGAKR